MKLRVLDLFSGIGGFSLGLERTGGFVTVAFCEIEPFPRRVLAKHWPGVPIYDDVRTLTADALRKDGIAVDIITGGFPCQDISTAGRQAGIVEGSRSGLWSEIARLTGELRPAYVVVENVANLLSGPSDRPGGWFGRVLGDLAELGYDAEWENIPASALGAPHRRERIWLIAYPSEVRRDTGRAEQSLQGVGLARQALVAYAHSQHWRGGTGRQDWPETHHGCEELADANRVNVQRIVSGIADPQEWGGSIERSAGPCGNGLGRWAPEPDVGRVANGVPDRAHRLSTLGNAVVPQIPQLIGNAILASLKEAS